MATTKTTSPARRAHLLGQSYYRAINGRYTISATRGMSGRGRFYYVTASVLMAYRTDLVDAGAYRAVEGLKYTLETGRTSGMTEAWVLGLSVRELCTFLGELSANTTTQADVPHYIAEHVEVVDTRHLTGLPTLARA